MLNVSKYQIGDILKVKFRTVTPIWTVKVESYEDSDPKQLRLNVRGMLQSEWHGTGIIDDDKQIIENVTHPVDYRSMYLELLDALKVIAKYLG